MPAGIPLALDPNRLMELKMRAAQGDPQAVQVLQSMQGGGGGPPGGPPPGMVPPGQGQLSPQGGSPPSSDVQAQRARQLIELLRARGG